MINRRILIISRSFYPRISPRSFRATELAKEFARQGNFVKVITPFNSNLDYEKMSRDFKIHFKNLGKEKFKTIKLHGSKPIIFIKRLINRALLMLIEYPDIQIMPLTIKALKDEDNYDLLISVAVPYPIHWGVARVRTKKRRIARIWIADCGDPFMGDRVDTFRKFFYFKYLEKWFCRKADYLTIPIAEGINGYYREFHYKIRIIPQGFNFEDIKLPSEVPFNKPICFAYTGGIVPLSRDPRPFLDFLCKQTMDFRFYFFTLKRELIKEYESILKEKLIIKDYIPRSELLPFLASMDFLVNFNYNTEIHLPSKLIDYAYTKRPILNIASDFDKNKVLAFLNRDYKDAFVVQDPEQYNISNISAKFLDLIHGC